jgi:hypothetical protein
MRIKGRLVAGKHEPLVSVSVWNACQKIRSIRASQHASNLEKRAIAKPFMGLMRCSLCSRSITGETVYKTSGKTYIYYHCAYDRCAAYRKNIKQDEIHRQLNKVFIPFGTFSQAAAAVLAEDMKIPTEILHMHLKQGFQHLCRELAETKHKILRLNALMEDGKISQVEHEKWSALAFATVKQHDLEIAASCNIDTKSFLGIFDIFRILKRISDYQRTDMDLMRKAEMAKAVLSKVLLDHGTLRYNYLPVLEHISGLISGT